MQTFLYKKRQTMSKKDTYKMFYALSIAWQLGFLIVIPIAAFLLLGLWGDRILKTEPFLLITGAIAGVLATYHGVYHLLTPLLDKKNHD
jgi:F0F1-type ATP synthase assembly protein I